MNTLEDVRKLSETAYLFLNELDPGIQAGEYAIGDWVIVKVKDYDTKLRRDSLFESHVKYINVQYMIQGEEIITLAPVDSLTVCKPYDADKDIVFYSSSNLGADHLLKPGQPMIIQPREGHMPGVAIDRISEVKKAIVKIPAD